MQRGDSRTVGTIDDGASSRERIDDLGGDRKHGMVHCGPAEMVGCPRFSSKPQEHSDHLEVETFRRVEERRGPSVVASFELGSGLYQQLRSVAPSQTCGAMKRTPPLRVSEFGVCSRIQDLAKSLQIAFGHRLEYLLGTHHENPFVYQVLSVSAGG